MRNIIFISTSLALLSIGAAQADPTFGCFERRYDESHLASHPNQVAQGIRLKIRENGVGNIGADLAILVADQGHAARSGQGGHLYSSALLCSSGSNGPGVWSCFVGCDSGALTFTHADRKMVEFYTDRLFIGASDECGGMFNIAEKPYENTTYRLFRVDDRFCEGH